MRDGDLLKSAPFDTGPSSGNPKRLQHWLIPWLVLCVFLTAIFALQRAREAVHNGMDTQVQDLAFLPPGEFLKPALLGYEHLAADILWLRTIQVLGQGTLSAPEYEWLYRALDVVTTLDPGYAYAYQAGGVILAELGHRPDLSTALLEKGLRANPDVWQIPFYLGYNHFFHFHDERRAAEYMALAAGLPGHPAYLPRLVVRLYAEAGSVDLALDWLIPLWRDAEDVHIKGALDARLKELTLTRDLQRLQAAVARYRKKYGSPPRQLQDLVRHGFLSSIPPEPFGGAYLLDPHTGIVASTTHPHGTRVKADPSSASLSSAIAPARPWHPETCHLAIAPARPWHAETCHLPRPQLPEFGSLPVNLPFSGAPPDRNQLSFRGRALAPLPAGVLRSPQQSRHAF